MGFVDLVKSSCGRSPLLVRYSNLGVLEYMCNITLTM